MFDWSKLQSGGFTALSDRGNVFHIMPVDDDPDGRWWCLARMSDGAYFKHRVDNRKKAEAYAEELEVQSMDQICYE